MYDPQKSITSNEFSKATCTCPEIYQTCPVKRLVHRVKTNKHKNTRISDVFSKLSDWSVSKKCMHQNIFTSFGVFQKHFPCNSSSKHCVHNSNNNNNNNNINNNNGDHHHHHHHHHHNKKKKKKKIDGCIYPSLFKTVQSAAGLQFLKLAVKGRKL